MADRVSRSIEESDTAAFHDLLCMGELATKLVTCGLLAFVQDDPERKRYGLEYGLARTSGIGEFANVIERILIGPTKDLLVPGSKVAIDEITAPALPQGGSWQRRTIDSLSAALTAVDPSFEPAPARTSLRWWFPAFARFRNRTRGHGSPTPATVGAALPHLKIAVDLLASELHLFGLPWIYLSRNMSSKFRVLPVSGDATPWAHLKSEKHHPYADGLYLGVEPDLHPVRFVETDVNLVEFYVINGALKETRDGGATLEYLDYCADVRKLYDASRLLAPTTPFPESETQGLSQLEVVGESFTNMPPAPSGYIPRPDLEAELESLLLDDRHPLISLAGGGGMGKTSLALAVLHRIAAQERFTTIYWFSARDVDLLPQGPRTVGPRVLSTDDVARDFCDLTLGETPTKAGDRRAHLVNSLSDPSRTEGPALFVFDNFETMNNPAEMLRFLDTYVQLPNKALLTTRVREYRGDYPVQVKGMQSEEFTQLCTQTAARLGVMGLVNGSYVDDLFEAAEGHPYIGKIAIGEVARAGRQVSLTSMLGGHERILSALFERTFANLSPAAQRVFLTLCSWKSVIAQPTLEAAMLRPGNAPMDVPDAVAELSRSSLVDVVETETGVPFLSCPVVANAFGRRKLAVSTQRLSIEQDVALLRQFGHVNLSEVHRGLDPLVYRMARAISASLDLQKDVSGQLAALEYVAENHAEVWLVLAALYADEPALAELDRAMACVERFLEVNPQSHHAWESLRGYARRAHDNAREVNADVTLAGLPSATVEKIERAAGTYMHHVSSLALDEFAKDAYAQRLIGLLEAHRPYLSPSGYGRLAWLYINQRDLAAATQSVQTGLALDPSNYHLLKIAERLHLPRVESLG
jgi:hypothetical protein